MKDWRKREMSPHRGLCVRSQKRKASGLCARYPEHPLLAHQQYERGTWKSPTLETSVICMQRLAQLPRMEATSSASTNPFHL